ncbi:MAG: hypothetical protein IKY92_01505 [Akkermansia sp.]|jgi:hypothetical protein|nr:hypothetical protein [Akkermansia sp.]
MTNHVGIVCGAVLSTALLPGAESVAQVGATLIGTGLLTWITISQGNEIRSLRKENRELAREIGKKCGGCELVKTANSMLKAAGDDYMEHN